MKALLRVKRKVESKVPLNPSGRIHAHPRNLLSATFKLPFLSITFGGFKPSSGFFIGVEVGVTLDSL